MLDERRALEDPPSQAFVAERAEGVYATSRRERHDGSSARRDQQRFGKQKSLGVVGVGERGKMLPDSGKPRSYPRSYPTNPRLLTQPWLVTIITNTRTDPLIARRPVRRHCATELSQQSIQSKKHNDNSKRHNTRSRGVVATSNQRPWGLVPPLPRPWGAAVLVSFPPIAP